MVLILLLLVHHPQKFHGWFGRLCIRPKGPANSQVIRICGMGVIGKISLARDVYDDPLITSHFDIFVWVTISQDYSAKRILSSLLESLKECYTGGLG